MNRDGPFVTKMMMMMDELMDWWADRFDRQVLSAMFRGVTPRCYKYHWKVVDDE